MRFRRRHKATQRRSFAVHLIRSHPDSDQLEQLLHGLAGLISKSQDRIKREAKTDNGQFLCDVVAEEGAIIDALLGCAFVLCQTYITAVFAGLSFAGRVLHRPDMKSRDKAMKMCAWPSTRRAKLTIIEAIDTAANYYKHNEAWITTWSGEGKDRVLRWDEPRALKNGAITTVGKVETWGLRPEDSKNMRKILKLLGINHSTDIPKLVEPLKAWRNALAKKVLRTSTRLPASA